jgi:chromosome segregation ATPase
MKRESQLKEEVDELKTSECKSSDEIQELKKIKSSNEQETQRLGKEVQKQVALLEQEKQKSGSSTHLISNLEQRLADIIETMNSLKRENDLYEAFLQSKNIEINLLNERYENMEKENQGLKRKLEEYQQ